MDLKTTLAIAYYRTYFKILGVISTRRAGLAALERFSRPRFRKQRSKTLPIFQKATLQFEEINGQNIAHYHWKGEREKSILLAHGWESDSGTFEGLIKYFLENGWSIRAVDAPAHGQSEGRNIRLPNYAFVIEKMLDKYPDIQAAIGHSFGAMALAYANDQQNSLDKFPPFVLIASAIELSQSMAPFIRILDLNPKVITAFYKAIEDLGNKPVSWYSLPRMLSSRNTPALIIHDEFDKVCPIKDLDGLRRKDLAYLEYHISNGLGHNRIVKDEKTWQRIDRFLAEKVLD